MCLPGEIPSERTENENERTKNKRTENENERTKKERMRERRRKERGRLCTRVCDSKMERKKYWVSYLATTSMTLRVTRRQPLCCCLY